MKTLGTLIVDSILQLDNQCKGKLLFNFHGKNSYAKARQSYFLPTFSVLFFFCVSVVRCRQRALRWPNSPTMKSYSMSKNKIYKSGKSFFLYRDTLRHSHSSNRRPNRNRVPVDVFTDFIPIPLALWNWVLKKAVLSHTRDSKWCSLSKVWTYNWEANLMSEVKNNILVFLMFCWPCIPV